MRFSRHLETPERPIGVHGKEKQSVRTKKQLQPLQETPEGIELSCIILFSKSAPSTAQPTDHCDAITFFNT